MPPTLEEIVLETARAALARQERAVDGLRGRTSTVLAAAALMASFLGAVAVDRGGLSWPTVVAIAALLALAALTGFVLLPHRLRFAADTRWVHADLRVDREAPDRYLLRLAFITADAYQANNAVVRRLEASFVFAIALLGVETGMWALALAI